MLLRKKTRKNIVNGELATCSIPGRYYIVLINNMLIHKLNILSVVDRFLNRHKLEKLSQE
jgi:hypothetical protein